MNNYNEPCLRLDWDTSVDEAINRVFVVGHKFILSGLKKLYHYFGLKWNFVLQDLLDELSVIVLIVKD